MRQNRSKAYRKLMAMYSTSFGFRQPYQVLVDSEMCRTAIAQKIELLTRMESVLVGYDHDLISSVCPSGSSVITQCCIHELYLQGKSQQPATDLAKSFERRKCNHEEAIPGDECIAAVVGETNKHRYVTATQSHPLRVRLRAIPGVPIVHLNRSVMVLEPASDATLQFKQRAEQNTLGPSASEKAMLSAVAPQPGPSVKKRKGPKGPNPLSVKKKAPKHRVQEGKKTTAVAAAQVEKVDGGKKRKRHEADGGSGTVSVETEPRSRRRRRHKATTREVDAV